MSRRWIVGSLLVVAVVAGCGGEKTDAEKAHESRDRALAAWDNAEGADWAAYSKGFAAAWGTACVDVALKLEPDFVESICSDGPGATEGPTYPPDSPKAQGDEDGFQQGCSHAYYEVRDKLPPIAYCEALALKDYKERRGDEAYCAELRKNREVDPYNIFQPDCSRVP